MRNILKIYWILMMLVLLGLLITLQIVLFFEQDSIPQKSQFNPIDYEELLEKIIQCESGGYQWATNNKETHGSSYGVAQFRLSTFNEFGELYGLKHDDIYDIDQQKNIMIRMLEDGLAEKHWINCYRKIYE